MDGVSAYKVAQGPVDSGRVAVANRCLQPGDVVLVERAIACVAVAGRSLCDDCLEPVREGGTQCTGCSARLGCNPPDSSAAPTLRLSAKLLRRMCLGLLGEGESLSMDSLVHHEQEFSMQQRRSDHERDCAQVVILAAGMSLPGAAGSLLSLEGSMRLLSRCYVGRAVPNVLDLAKKELARVCVNAVTTCDGSGATGLGLFPSAAMFNHSCSPNTQAWWRGSKLELRCSKALLVGEELCFSYIPIDQPSDLRREQLRHSWFFTCCCRRCVSGKWDAELTGLRCPVVGCAGAVPPPWRDLGAACNRCGCYKSRLSGSETGKSPTTGETVSLRSATPSPSEDGTRLALAGLEERLLQARQDFEDGMEAYMREEAEAALVALEKSLLVRESLLHAFHKDVLRTLRYASYAAVATHSWAKARSFLLRWLDPMDVMFGAAEVWDTAVMRIDLGLVLDKLHTPSASGAALQTPSASASTKSKPQKTQTTANQVHPAAFAELAQGLRWLWICLGRDSGLPGESAALEACSGMDVSAATEL